MEHKSIYYLFGEEACKVLSEEGKEEFNKRKDEFCYDTFEFIVGITHPSDLLDGYDGWRNYAEITEEFFKRLTAEPNKVDLQKKYKEQTGKSVWVPAEAGNEYYDNGYIEWIEERLRLLTESK